VKRAVKFLVRMALYSALVALIGGSLLWSFWPKPVAVESATVARGPMEVTVDEDGKTRIRERYVVSTPLSGKLLRIDLDPGDRVCGGKTLLATIEPVEPEMLDARALAQAEAKVKAAEASLARVDPLLERASVELKHAKIEWDRLEALANTKAISQDQLDSAITNYRAREQDSRAARFAQDIARFELEMAKAALQGIQCPDGDLASNRHFNIYSPINGQVLRVFQESATVVAAGSRLLELGDPSELEVEVDVLSHDAVKIRHGARARLEQWGGDEPLRAVVRLVEPSAYTKISALGVEEQRVNVILDLEEPLERRRVLGDGFRVDARIVIWESPDVLQVPTGAMFRHVNQWAVFVLDKGCAKLRTLQIGQRNSLAAELLEGLREGDQVILHPSDKVRDGVRVEIKQP
jgi:HlyD family secretion protein